MMILQTSLLSTVIIRSRAIIRETPFVIPLRRATVTIGVTVVTPFVIPLRRAVGVTVVTPFVISLRRTMVMVAVIPTERTSCK